MHWCYLLILITLGFYVTAQNIIEPAYCYQFTWPGPTYYSEDAPTKCDDLIGEDSNAPCIPPIIANGTTHLNMSELWEKNRNNKLAIACVLQASDVCVKYTYKYNYAVENVTFMCSKVSVVNDGPATSSCFTEYQNGREIEVCACQSTSGQEPCNSANWITASVRSSVAFLIWIVIAVTIATELEMVRGISD